MCPLAVFDLRRAMENYRRGTPRHTDVALLLDPRALGRVLVKPQTARGLTDGGGTKVRI
jgi:hypothetical protein